MGPLQKYESATAQSHTFRDPGLTGTFDKLTTKTLKTNINFMQVLNVETIKDMVRDIILNDLDSNINASDIRDDVSLYDDGLGLDSIAIINFIVLVEKKFEISFEESEISADLFSSINSVADFLHEKLAIKQENQQAING